MSTPPNLDEIEAILQFSSNADRIFKAADTLLTECRHLRAENERLKAQQRWRSVTDEPPCDLEELIIASDGLVTRGCRSESGTWLSEALTPADEVTHWMPFPDPPAD